MSAECWKPTRTRPVNWTLISNKFGGRSTRASHEAARGRATNFEARQQREMLSKPCRPCSTPQHRCSDGVVHEETATVVFHKGVSQDIAGRHCFRTNLTLGLIHLECRVSCTGTSKRKARIDQLFYIYIVLSPALRPPANSVKSSRAIDRAADSFLHSRR